MVKFASTSFEINHLWSCSSHLVCLGQPVNKRNLILSRIKRTLNTSRRCVMESGYAPSLCQIKCTKIFWFMIFKWVHQTGAGSPGFTWLIHSSWVQNSVSLNPAGLQMSASDEQDRYERNQLHVVDNRYLQNYANGILSHLWWSLILEKRPCV